MTTFNTGNPIGSTDARDRSDNSENMDILENSTTLNAHPDRLGTMRKTRKGMELEHDNQISAHEAEHDAQIAAHEAEHDNQMQSFENEFDGRLAGMAFTRVGTFTTGTTLTDMRQTLLWEVSQGGDGHEYGWTGAFPKVVAAGATPATSGGIGAGAWVDRTDVTLRSDMNVVVKVFDSVSDMVADASLIVGQKCRTLGYYAVGDGGGNDYIVVAAATGTDDGGSYIDLSGSGFQAKGLFGSVVNVRQFGAVGDGIADDTSAIQNAINLEISTEIYSGTYLVSNTIVGKSSLICKDGIAELIQDVGVFLSGITYTSRSNFTVEGIYIRSQKTTLLWGGGKSGIGVSSCDNFSIKRCKAKYFTDGVGVSNSSNFDISDNLISEMGEEIIAVRNSTGYLISGNEGYHHNGDGILIKPTAGTPQSGVIVGNYIHDGVNIYGYGTIGGGITCNTETLVAGANIGVSISENTIKNTFYGIGLIGGVNFSVNCNKIYNTTEDGISCVYGANYNTTQEKTEYNIVTGNVIDGCRDGITVFNTESVNYVDNHIVSGNIVRSFSRYGVRCETPSSINGNIINLDSLRSAESAIRCSGCSVSSNKIKIQGTLTDSTIRNVGTNVISSNKITTTRRCSLTGSDVIFNNNHIDYTWTSGYVIVFDVGTPSHVILDGNIFRRVTGSSLIYNPSAIPVGTNIDYTY